jgi:excisionase family DNA binding protein
MERYLSTQQVAEQLGLHRTTILRLVADGFIDARIYSYGSRPTIRISQEALDAFVARYTGTDLDGLADEPPSA